MYEQDYIMRINREIIRTIAKLVLNIDMENPFDVKLDTIKIEDSITLESLYGQVDLGQINAAENELYSHIYNDGSRALEKALLFYTYLNDKDDEFLQNHNYSREEIQMGLKDIANRYGFENIIDILLEN